MKTDEGESFPLPLGDNTHLYSLRYMGKRGFGTLLNLFNNIYIHCSVTLFEELPNKNIILLPT